MMIKSIFLMIFFGLMNVFTPTDLTDLHRSQTCSVLLMTDYDISPNLCVSVRSVGDKNDKSVGDKKREVGRMSKYPCMAMNNL